MSEIIFKNELVVGKAYFKKCYELIESASLSIDVVMYEWKWYTNDPSSNVQRLNQALVRAVKRGVKVRALVNEGRQCTLLNQLGIEAKTNLASVVMHTKAVIIDGEHVLMGSHNFTEKAMTSNIETSTYFKDATIAKQLSEYMVSLWL
jgi:phosphatidylserine/phosphatidylglycerophosphate/cardiolipin synthase-like enzyme